MDLRDLNHFLAVCRAGGISGAARELQLSQPSLSRSIAKLEAELGLRLFDRSTGAARPTAYGEFLHERASAVLREVEDLTNALQQIARGEQGRLRIGVGPATRRFPLPRLLERLAERYPNLRIEIINESGVGVMDAVEGGRADLGIGNATRALPHLDLIRKKLFDDEIVLVGRQGHPALAIPQAGPRELLRFPFAMPNVTPNIARWAGKLTTPEAENLRAFVCDDYEAIIDRVVRTDAIAMGPTFLFAEALEARRLAIVRSTLEIPYACWLVTTADMWRSPLIREIADLALEACRSATT